ncbi:MAG: N-acetylglucosamine-6-phosphate deacetylase [Vicinamibacterales bacterium]
MSAAFFDLQVNGYGGVDFNQDELDADQLHRACERLEADRVAGFLATIITDDLPAMCRRLLRLTTLRAADPLAQRLIAGVHIEGPFLSASDGYRGAHPLDAIRPADTDSMARLLEAASGLARVVTLAPERDAGFAVTRFLACRGILVSAGHTDATLDQLRGAIDAGLSMFTHVGNGCPMHMHRHDNIIQRALSLADDLWLCFIADGVHVPFVALRNYLKLAREDRAIVVTDAIAPAGLGPGRYKFARWDLEIGDDMVARAPDRSHLVGSGITMKQNAENLQHAVGLSESAVRKLTLENPRIAIGA